MNRTAEALCVSCALVATGPAAAWAGGERGRERAGAAPSPATGAPSDPAAGEVILVEGRAPGHAARDRDRALGEAPFVTILHPDEHPAAASVADALGGAAGAQTRSLGGLGAYQSVSVRGAAPGHTVVLIDGVPLARLAEVTTDLGRYALDAFGEVELYRGAVPVELGGAGTGGAVNLVTRLGRGERGSRLRASIGAGSFGARHARLRYGDEHAGGQVRSAVTLGYAGASGDYTYFTDGGTPLEPTDDGYEVRRNNRFDQLDAAARAGLAGRPIAGGVRLAWKRQGLPGSVAQPALAAAMSTLDAVLDARVGGRVGGAIARGLGYVLVERQALRDPAGELGLGAQDRGYLTLSGGGATAWAVPLGRHRATAGLELRGDRFRDADRAGARAPLVGMRAGGAVSAEAELAVAGGAVAVTPAARLDIVRTAPSPRTEGPDALVPIAPRWDLVPSPRLTARARLAGDLAVKGSAGWYVRLPTLLELFGDRGMIVGAPDLLPERGPSADLGVVWAPAREVPTDVGPIDRILVEAAAFAARPRDTIALISTAGFVARAENVGATSRRGAELVLAARFSRTLSLTASYTRLATAQQTIDPSLRGKPLPRTPGHLGYGRAELARRLAGRLASLWSDVAVQSTATLDAAGFRRVPARALVGAGARLELTFGLAAAFAVANLGGTRVVTIPPERPIDPPVRTALADLAGYPLPGRSFYLSLDWTH
jgi:iron complex outermembrane receptor protein